MSRVLCQLSRIEKALQKMQNSLPVEPNPHVVQTVKIGGLASEALLDTLRALKRLAPQG